MTSTTYYRNPDGSILRVTSTEHRPGKPQTYTIARRLLSKKLFSPDRPISADDLSKLLRPEPLPEIQWPLP
ncbi:hypothetical protein [Hymenobacter sp.]|jgi:hypothetical protein|uniref:hypothetical protein n=1 Tax=Hymenobacter sp. TaxID=1898978 RepID=UPI002ED98AB8